MDLKDKNQMSDQELDKVSGGDFIINISEAILEEGE